MALHAHADLHETSELLCADLDADGCNLIAVQDEIQLGRVHLVKVGVVFFLSISHIVKAQSGHFAVKVDILGIQPINLEMRDEREAVLAHLADEGVLARHVAGISQADGVVTKGEADADDLVETARVGDIKRTDVVRLRINHAAGIETEAAGGQVPVADAELVFVAPDRV